MPKDLLYEIGVEEIPASFVLPALEQLERGLHEGLTKLRLGHGQIRTYGTPRRLAVTVADITDRQPDLEQEYKGPSVDKAFDAEGKPTRAAEGFARSRGVSVDSLQVMQTEKGSWVYARVLEPGRPAEEVLPPLLSEVTLGLSFPKTMRWGNLDVRFARPIRWLVALLDGQVLDLEIAGVRAGAETRGHRFLMPGPLSLSGADEYVSALRAAFVLADPLERREAIRASAQHAAQQVGGRARIDEDLLTEVSFLVEWPTCLWGRFDPRYLELPEPVIVTVMQAHQRYFPVEDHSGKLMPYFVAVRNGGEEGLELVRRGNEKVIVPRLEDAEFYLTEDLAHSLEERVHSLGRVTFMEGMGTLLDKTHRLERLVEHLANAVARQDCEAHWAEAGAVARRAAHLCKADLVTLMVGDTKLGELQGVIGGEYARRLGEDASVATAIAEHYRPRGAADGLPETAAGTLLSIADKLDNLAACFRLGAVPSGSADPFALRRQAQGIVDMLLAHNLRVNLPQLVELALSLLPEPQTQKAQDAARVLAPAAAKEALMAFFAQRLDSVLTRDGVTYDVSRAVLAAPWEDPLEVYERGRFLQRLRQDEEGLFNTLVTAGERPARITRPESLPADSVVQPALFQHPWERRLLGVAQVAERQVSEALATSPRDYGTAVRALADLAEPIHQFFEEVMVMVDDERLRNNRLALLRGIDRTFLRIADFLEIVREGS